MTVAFSTVDAAWGSYSYDPAEDALRVSVTPRDAEPQERLAYRFDGPDDDSATLVLSWAGREVPVQITADTSAIVLASMERELRGVAGFSPRAGTRSQPTRSTRGAAWTTRSGGRIGPSSSGPGSPTR